MSIWFLWTASNYLHICIHHLHVKRRGRTQKIENSSLHHLLFAELPDCTSSMSFFHRRAVFVNIYFFFHHVCIKIVLSFEGLLTCELDLSILIFSPGSTHSLCSKAMLAHSCDAIIEYCYASLRVHSELYVLQRKSGNRLIHATWVIAPKQIKYHDCKKTGDPHW